MSGTPKRRHPARLALRDEVRSNLKPEADCVVIVMAKAPIAGYAKSRLAPVLGAAGAAVLAERLLVHAVQQAASAGFDTVELCTTPDASHPAFRRLKAQHRLRLTGQGDGDLGERMHRALSRALATHARALLIGTDAPALDSGILLSAARALDEADAVFVPARDGGYALVGLRRPLRSLFEGVIWSTGEVMRQTRERAAASGLRLVELAPVADIDEPADLVHLPPGVDVRRLLLIGAGHAHALVLRAWARRRLPATELVLVSPAMLAPYSGMVPGWLAGTYRFDEICIDVAALAAAAGARLLIDELSGLDPERRQVRLASGATLDYDLLSLNTGSTLEPPAARGLAVLSLRPLGRLHAAWESRLQELQACAGRRPLVVTAVGGGAAGLESLLAVLTRLRSLQSGTPVAGRLVSSATTLLPGMAPGAARAAERALARAGVSVRLDTSWTDAMADEVVDEAAGGRGLLLWAAGAGAHAWQRDPARRAGLATSVQGFVRVNAELRSVSHPEVFAAGDCADWSTPLPKAGVYAVRMGAVLAQNLRAALDGSAAVPYRPQHRFLALMATGDGRAIGSRGRWSAEGRWLWHWKDHIDRSFLRRFKIQ